MEKSIQSTKQSLASTLKGNFLAFFRVAFFKNRINLSLTIIGLVLNILIWILLARFIRPSEYPIPLHYNVYFGIDLIGNYQRVFTLPLIGLFIIIINLFLSIWLYNKERLLSYIFTFASFAVQIFVLIGTISLIYINQ